MYATAKKEQFNYAFIKAIASQVGINSATPTVDDDSIDIMLFGKDFPGVIRDPQINIQLKCTHRDMRIGDNIRFPLERKNYDDLRDERVGIPRYLAVLEVPENPDEWAIHDDSGTILSSKCYWSSLVGLPEKQTNSITVSVPLAQRLTAESLYDLLLDASKAGVL